jgi:recombination protein RecT
MSEELTVQRTTRHKLELVPLLDSKLPDVRHALPPGTIEPERLKVAFLAAFNRNPKLAECTQMSICSALVNCASLGLVPNTPEQHAYLIPRKSGKDSPVECNLEIGYRGFVHMILRGGKVSHVESGIVHKGDTYQFQKGDPVICTHSPNLETPNRSQTTVLAAYCLIVFANGGKRLEVMDGDDLKKIEAAMMRQNFNKQSPAWREWGDEMRRKAPIKRIAKTCDLGPLLARAAELDNEPFRHLPSLEPKKIVLGNGETLPTLPRHEAEAVPADDTDASDYSKGDDLF